MDKFLVEDFCASSEHSSASAVNLIDDAQEVVERDEK